MMGDGRLLLLHGVEPGSDSEDDLPETEYCETPLATVYALLEKHFLQQLESFSPSPASGMVRVAKSRSPCEVVCTLESLAVRRRHLKKGLLFVYDHVCSHTTFGQLRFVIGVDHAALQQYSDEEFQIKYGVTRRLEFRYFTSRRPFVRDWWGGILQ